ncbi:MAG TPA: cytochrome c oxidase assembly protein, partial [Kineosporiaceae bacterium]|nr:cytochrome c oxidase assembly protein [Kineosporiaceae bacterium]
PLWALPAVAGAVLLLALSVGGGAPQPAPLGIPDPGPVTGWGLPALRLAADLAAVAAVGLALGAAFLLPAPSPELRGERARQTDGVAWAAALEVLLVGIELPLTLSNILAIPPAQALDPTLLDQFVTQTDLGRALAAQFVLAAVTAVTAVLVRSGGGAAWLLVLTLAGLVPQALAGHTAGSAGHTLAVASLLVHVLAAALWCGGLFALVVAARRGVAGLRFAVPRFSALALWCFAAVAISGVVNAGIRLGSVGALLGTTYGGLVLAKAGALLVLAAFGRRHRSRTVPALLRRAETGGGSGVPPFAALATAELTVMAATFGLAVALGRTPTPAQQALPADPGSQLLGFAMPPAPTPAHLLLGFTADGFALVVLALGASLYAAGVFALRRRGDRWPIGRTISWAAGLAVFAWCTIGGLGVYSHVLFSAHMGAHMLVSMLAPVLFVLGAPATLALRSLPGARVKGERGPRQLLLAVLHSRAARVLTHPVVASAIFVGSLYLLYFSGLYPALMTNHLGHTLMQLHFLAAGLLFFYVIIGVDPAPRRIHPLAAVGLLFAAMALHAFFSIAVMSSRDVLALGYFGALQRPYARDLLADQHLGGGLSWGLGELPIVLVLAVVLVRWVRADDREARRRDRAADRAAATGQGVDELAAYNAYLASLQARAGDDRR